MGEVAKTAENAPKKSFFKGLKSEFKKVIWPDRQSLVKQSVAVLISSVVLGLVIALLDMGIQFIMNAILQIG